MFANSSRDNSGTGNQMSSELVRNHLPEYPEFQGVSIVALGSFNPAIFHPLWFSGNGLMRVEEATSANVQIVHRDITQFSTDWFSLHVLDARFCVETNDASMFQPLRDLVLGTFKILEHCPVKSFGFNTHQHFQMPTLDAWHQFGHHYAPKPTWEKVLVNPGMAGLTMQGEREGCRAKRIEIRIGPSSKIERGVFVIINEHYEVDSSAGGENTDVTNVEYFLEAMSRFWDAFLAYSKEVGCHLIKESA